MITHLYKLILVAIMGGVLLALSATNKAKADSVAYYRAINPAQIYTQPNLTNWVGATNAGDQIEVSKLGYYGSMPIAYEDSTGGWTNLRNLTVDKRMTNNDQLNDLKSHMAQYKPSPSILRHYYHAFTQKRHHISRIKTKRRIGVYHTPHFTAKPAYTIAKHKVVRVVDFGRDGSVFRFELVNGDYITAAKNAVKLF